ncbi:hypothetical protein [Methanococcus maripaludis]|uniref:Uncharacterized protein n=1 Tax=Methanococcus maripaludis TaxID=39152 RepID=A0A7J9S2U4_METMI|nr:hypothetical protein [Methanococcus maripaludis]MBB6067867.1 hypothetical protein [Methanococcus maripaludis]
MNLNLKSLGILIFGILGLFVFGAPTWVAFVYGIVWGVADNAGVFDDKNKNSRRRSETGPGRQGP